MICVLRCNFSPLVLKQPELNNSPTNHATWRSSVALFGSPLVDDGMTLPTWLNARGHSDAFFDNDNNGMVDQLDYALATDLDGMPLDLQPSISIEPVTIEDITAQHIVIRHRQRINADDVEWGLEFANELNDWASAPISFVPIRRIHNGDGTMNITYRSTYPFGSATARGFVRFRTIIVP